MLKNREKFSKQKKTLQSTENDEIVFENEVIIKRKRNKFFDRRKIFNSEIDYISSLLEKVEEDSNDLI